MTTGVACDESEANTAGEPTALSPVPTSEELRSAKKRAAPAATNTEVADLVRGNSAFAFDLYQNLRDNNGNLFYSPYSISLALAMTYAGARGRHRAADGGNAAVSSCPRGPAPGI